MSRIARFVLMFSALLACGCAARASGPELTTIAFGSCAKQDRPQPIWDAVLAARPQVWVWLGDNIYADTEDMAVMAEKYRLMREVPGYKRLRESGVRILATWDDHDFGANDAGAEYPKKVESQKLFMDAFDEPADSPRRKQQGVYASYLFGPPGKQVQIILLDTRYHRSPLKAMDPRPERGGFWISDPDPDKTFLGAEQWRWLEDQLKVPAQLRIIGSSIQFVSEEHNYEKWANFPRERERLLGLMKKTGAARTLFISGDRHAADLSKMDGGIGYPVWDLTSSSLNSPIRPERRGDDPNRHRVGDRFVEANFGLIALEWADGDLRSVRLEIRDERGKAVIRQRIDAAELQGANPPQAVPAK